MSLAKETRRCPFCRETIATTATRCKHCHADLSDLPRKRLAFLKKINTFRTGFLCGILFAILITILVYFQFYAGE
ncbi:MAG: hypothetical protein J7J98_06810 [candidate division Zixibacteria bacterium]|nr:hypothetical protein [candidate division Zixibacteria bacterium]